MKHLFTLIAFLLAAPWAFASEDDELTAFARNIITFNREHPQEKVYLHMDNRSYFIGDTIWFKAYVMNATTLRPTETSGVLYVELLNEKGVEIDHRKLEIKDGMCHGEFPLQDNYRTGYYEIRAYTRNMLNFGDANDIIAFYDKPTVSIMELVKEENLEATFSNKEQMSYEVSKGEVSSYLEEIIYEEDDSLNTERRQGYRRYIREKKKEWTYNWVNHNVFSRVVPVYCQPKKAGAYEHIMEEYPLHPNLAKPQILNQTELPDRLQIRIYPEGGMLVDGVESVIAIETCDRWGRKQNVNGLIEDINGNVITTFSSTSRGRGKATLRPWRATPYFICINYKNRLYRYPLPYIERQGYGITLTPPVETNDNATIVVKASPNNDVEQIGWTLQCRGELLAYDTLSVAAGSQTNICIPTSQLTGGVNQFTLYNTHGEVLADRLFWVIPTNHTLKNAVVNAPTNIAPYERISFDIQIGGKRKKHQESMLSISVTDATDRTDSYDTRNIWSELLLSSELKGFIEDVDSYFKHDSRQAIADDIDLLMLVQGWRWRRYEWHTMAGSEPYTLPYTPEYKLGIDGYVIGEASDTKGPSYHANSYPRIPNLEVDMSFKVTDNIPLGYTAHCDSSGNFSMELERPIYGTIPLTLVLLDKENASQKLSTDRLWNSQIVINRAFCPQPKAIDYYEKATRIFPVGQDTTSIAMPIVASYDSPLENGIYIDCPDMIVDYEREWNWLIDRGIPKTNYQLNNWKAQYHLHHYMNYPYLSYSLRRMNASDNVVISRDSFYTQVATQYHIPYRMPKKIKVYSNLLGRSFVFSAPTIMPFSYLVVEHCSSEESPELPPFLPNKGVRHTYYEGYSRATEFYSPDYSECALPDSADYRRTLYWNPNVETDDRGRSSITFYNNAHTKRLHIRAERFTRNGEFIIFDSDKE